MMTPLRQGKCSVDQTQLTRTPNSPFTRICNPSSEVLNDHVHVIDRRHLSGDSRASSGETGGGASNQSGHAGMRDRLLRAVQSSRGGAPADSQDATGLQDAVLPLSRLRCAIRLRPCVNIPRFEFRALCVPRS